MGKFCPKKAKNYATLHKISRFNHQPTRKTKVLSVFGLYLKSFLGYLNVYSIKDDFEMSLFAVIKHNTACYLSFSDGATI